MREQWRVVYRTPRWEVLYNTKSFEWMIVRLRDGEAAQVTKFVAAGLKRKGTVQIPEALWVEIATQMRPRGWTMEEVSKQYVENRVVVRKNTRNKKPMLGDLVPVSYEMLSGTGQSMGGASQPIGGVGSAEILNLLRGLQ